MLHLLSLLLGLDRGYPISIYMADLEKLNLNSNSSQILFMITMLLTIS